MQKKRKKTWAEKVKLVSDSFLRSSVTPSFAKLFYENLFFLNPKIKDYFTNTDFEHQEKALINGLQFLVGYLDKTDENSRRQVIRIAKTHSSNNMNIHPHHYYYWIEALIMTAKKSDTQWHSDLEYYWREVFSLPVHFIISQYYSKD